MTFHQKTLPQQCSLLGMRCCFMACESLIVVWNQQQQRLRMLVSFTSATLVCDKCCQMMVYWSISEDRMLHYQEQKDENIVEQSNYLRNIRHNHKNGTYQQPISPLHHLHRHHLIRSTKRCPICPETTAGTKTKACQSSPPTTQSSSENTSHLSSIVSLQKEKLRMK